MLPSTRPAARGLLPALLIALALITGCATDRPGPGGRKGLVAKIPTLTGQQAFYAGIITAEVEVGAMAGFARPDQRDGENPEGRRRRGGDGPEGMGGGRPRERPDGGPQSAQPGGTRIATSHNPPVSIHLRFTNHGTETADLVITDFLSPLGNFVVEPSRLTLAAGQTVEVEPMTSRLTGDIPAGEIALTLALAGTRETKTVTLHVKAGDDDAP